MFSFRNVRVLRVVHPSCVLNIIILYDYNEAAHTYANVWMVVSLENIYDAF